MAQYHSDRISIYTLLDNVLLSYEFREFLTVILHSRFQDVSLSIPPDSCKGYDGWKTNSRCEKNLIRIVRRILEVGRNRWLLQ